MIAIGVIVAIAGLLAIGYSLWLMQRRKRSVLQRIAASSEESGLFGVSLHSPEGRDLIAARRAPLIRSAGIAVTALGVIVVAVGFATR